MLVLQVPHGGFRQPVPAVAAAQRGGMAVAHGNPAAGYYPGPAANRGGPASSRFAGGAAAPGQRAYAQAPVQMAAPTAYGQQQQYAGAHADMQPCALKRT